MEEKKDEKRSVNFTIVPDDTPEVPRVYSNFCSIQNSPFDFTLTFCEMHPIGERQLQEAASTHLVKAPVKAPGVSGLYFAGDTVKGYGVAMDCACAAGRARATQVALPRWAPTSGRTPSVRATRRERMSA